MKAFVILLCACSAVIAADIRSRRQGPGFPGPITYGTSDGFDNIPSIHGRDLGSYSDLLTLTSSLAFLLLLNVGVLGGTNNILPFLGNNYAGISGGFPVRYFGGNSYPGGSLTGFPLNIFPPGNNGGYLGRSTGTLLDENNRRYDVGPIDEGFDRTSPNGGSPLPQNTAGPGFNVGPYDERFDRTNPNGGLPLPQNTAGPGFNVGPFDERFGRTNPNGDLPLPQNTAGPGFNVGPFDERFGRTNPNGGLPLPQNTAGPGFNVGPFDERFGRTNPNGGLPLPQNTAGPGFNVGPFDERFGRTNPNDGLPLPQNTARLGFNVGPFDERVGRTNPNGDLPFPQNTAGPVQPGSNGQGFARDPGYDDAGPYPNANNGFQNGPPPPRNNRGLEPGRVSGPPLLNRRVANVNADPRTLPPDNDAAYERVNGYSTRANRALAPEFSSAEVPQNEDAGEITAEVYSDVQSVPRNGILTNVAGSRGSRGFRRALDIDERTPDNGLNGGRLRTRNGNVIVVDNRGETDGEVIYGNQGLTTRRRRGRPYRRVAVHTSNL